MCSRELYSYFYYSWLLLLLLVPYCADKPGKPRNVENGPTLMCWEEPFDSCPIKYYEIEYITHGSPKCRREESNRWDLPRANVHGVRIRAVDECEQKGEMFNVTLNLYSSGKNIIILYSGKLW